MHLEEREILLLREDKVEAASDNGVLGASAFGIGVPGASASCNSVNGSTSDNGVPSADNGIPDPSASSCRLASASASNGS